MKKRFAAIAVLLCLCFVIGCAAPKEETTTETTTAETTTEKKTETTTAAPETTTGQAQIDAEAIRMDASAYPRVDGSTATLPLSYAVYMLATGSSQEEAEANIIHSKTTNAYYNLAYGQTDLLIVYEASPETLTEIEQTGVKLLIEPVGKDALVFMKNEKNPVESLTSEQLRDVYAGKINNWKDVGGEDLPIVAFQRPAGSGSQTLMESLIMKGTKMADAPANRIISSMGGILDEVASYQNTADALGYSVFYYAKNMYEIPGLAFLGVDGVMPSTDTIRTDEYGLVNPFYVVIREDTPADAPARQIFDWLLSEEGQKLVEESGYVPAH